MKGSFSEESLARFTELASQKQPADFSEGGTYDFTRCVRPNGTAYGTGGKCRKGTEEAAQEKKAINDLGSMLPKGEKIVDRKGGTHTAGGGKETGRMQELTDEIKTFQSMADKARENGFMDRAVDYGKKASKLIRERADLRTKSETAEKPKAPAGGNSRGSVDHEARIAKHDADHEAAKTAHAASKAALAAHRGRDAQSRAKKQQLAYEHQRNTEKLETAADKLIRAKIAGKKSEDAAKPKAPAGSDLKKKMTEMATRIKRQETAIERMSPGKYTRKEIEIEKQTLQEMKAKLKGLVSGKAAVKSPADLATPQAKSQTDLNRLDKYIQEEAVKFDNQRRAIREGLAKADDPAVIKNLALRQRNMNTGMAQWTKLQEELNKAAAAQSPQQAPDLSPLAQQRRAAAAMRGKD